MLFDQLLQLFIYVRCLGRYRPLKVNQAVWQAFKKTARRYTGAPFRERNEW